MTKTMAATTVTENINMEVIIIIITTTTIIITIRANMEVTAIRIKAGMI